MEDDICIFAKYNEKTDKYDCSQYPGVHYTKDELKLYCYANCGLYKSKVQFEKEQEQLKEQQKAKAIEFKINVLQDLANKPTEDWEPFDEDDEYDIEYAQDELHYVPELLKKLYIADTLTRKQQYQLLYLQRYYPELHRYNMLFKVLYTLNPGIVEHLELMTIEDADNQRTAILSSAKLRIE